MSLPTLYEEIESIQFSASVAVMSGFRSLLNMLAKKEAIKQLVALIRADQETANKIADRAMGVLFSEPEAEFQHSFDAALLGYLFALNEAHKSVALQVALRLMAVPNLFWARRLAETIISTKQTISMNVTYYPMERTYKTVSQRFNIELRSSSTSSPVPIAFPAPMRRLGVISYSGTPSVSNVDVDTRQARIS